MSNRIKLERFAHTPFGVFGYLWFGENFVYTVERDWLDNYKRISCIPAGEYVCKPRMYYRGGYPAIHVTGVPNRSYILIHRGNTKNDLEGCIAVGTGLGMVNGMWAVINSKAAHDRLLKWADNSEFTLEIEDLKIDYGRD